MRLVFAYALAFVFAAIAFGVVFSGRFDETIVNSPVTGAATTSSPDPTASATTTVISTSTALFATSSTTSEIPTKKSVAKVPENPVIKPNNRDSITSNPATSTAQKAPSPYAFAPESPDVIEKALRAALVNILCMPQGGTLRPISGSGVFISSDGVILTNAHVAQYVLLSEDARINLTCHIRSGSPATPRWKAAVLYIPPVWVDAHYKELNEDHAAGTGEHDYALLKLVSDTSGNPFSGAVPYLPIETRENVAFEGDPVLVAGYPAEFVGGLAAQQSLYASISPSTIKKLLTFNTGTIDVLSVGGVLVAQGGSSGGPVVNVWGRMVGLIVTTSAGATTAQRELHTLNLNYIERDFTGNTGISLEELLSRDTYSALDVFTRNVVPGLMDKYISLLAQ